MELEVADPTGLPAAVKKLLQVVMAAPRMEAWIGQVCESVYGGSVEESSSLFSLVVGLLPATSSVVSDAVKKVWGKVWGKAAATASYIDWLSNPIMSHLYQPPPYPSSPAFLPHHTRVPPCVTPPRSHTFSPPAIRLSSRPNP